MGTLLKCEFLMLMSLCCRNVIWLQFLWELQGVFWDLFIELKTEEKCKKCQVLWQKFILEKLSFVAFLHCLHELHDVFNHSLSREWCHSLVNNFKGIYFLLNPMAAASNPWSEIWIFQIYICIYINRVTTSIEHGQKMLGWHFKGTSCS